VPTRQSSSVAGVIERFSPTSVGPVAAVFARRVVAEARPASVARAKAFLFAAAELGEFAASVGLEPTKVNLPGADLASRLAPDISLQGHQVALRGPPMDGSPNRTCCCHETTGGSRVGMDFEAHRTAGVLRHDERFLPCSGWPGKVP
jgi:hypothetical protein